MIELIFTGFIFLVVVCFGMALVEESNAQKRRERDREISRQYQLRGQESEEL